MAEYRKVKKEYYDKINFKDENGLVRINYEARRFRIPQYGDTWGIWKYCSNETLTCKSYEVDLERMKSSAAVLDWIIQVSGKRWVTAKDLADLVYAIDDILKLQQNYCGHGVELKNK